MNDLGWKADDIRADYQPLESLGKEQREVFEIMQARRIPFVQYRGCIYLNVPMIADLNPELN